MHADGVGFRAVRNHILCSFGVLLLGIICLYGPLWVRVIGGIAISLGISGMVVFCVMAIGSEGGCSY
jgi:hypothetical protein